MNYCYNQNPVDDWRLGELETIISDIENDFIKYVSCQKIVAERNYLNLMLDSCAFLKASSALLASISNS